LFALLLSSSFSSACARHDEPSRRTRHSTPAINTVSRFFPPPSFFSRRRHPIRAAGVDRRGRGQCGSVNAARSWRPPPPCGQLPLSLFLFFPTSDRKAINAQKADHSPHDYQTHCSLSFPSPLWGPLRDVVGDRPEQPALIVRSGDGHDERVASFFSPSSFSNRLVATHFAELGIGAGRNRCSPSFPLPFVNLRAVPVK